MKAEVKALVGIASTVGLGVLAWAGTQYASLPTRLTIQETKMSAVEGRLSKMDDKLDLILDRLPRR